MTVDMARACPLFYNRAQLSYEVVSQARKCVAQTCIDFLGILTYSFSLTLELLRREIGDEVVSLLALSRCLFV